VSVRKISGAAESYYKKITSVTDGTAKNVIKIEIGHLCFMRTLKNELSASDRVLYIFYMILRQLRISGILIKSRYTFPIKCAYNSSVGHAKTWKIWSETVRMRQQEALSRGHAILSVRTMTLGQQDRGDRAKRRTFYIRY